MKFFDGTKFCVEQLEKRRRKTDCGPTLPTTQSSVGLGFRPLHGVDDSYRFVLPSSDPRIVSTLGVRSIPDVWRSLFDRNNINLVEINPKDKIRLLRL